MSLNAFLTSHDAEVASLQERQGALLPLLFAEATAAEALASYEQTVEELTALLGPNAHCARVDAELWSQFSDFYKEETGCRPRHHVSRKQAQDYINNLPAERVFA